ncbi:hypothetical protein DZS_07150 [Dickeya ananatis]
MSNFDRKKITSKIHPVVNKIQTSKLVNGITGGMMGAMPITILGAFAALFFKPTNPSLQGVHHTGRYCWGIKKQLSCSLLISWLLYLV